MFILVNSFEPVLPNLLKSMIFYIVLKIMMFIELILNYGIGLLMLILIQFLPTIISKQLN